MASFKCPQCHADVTKLKGEDPGCPCCGYGEQGTIAPYFPFQFQPIVVPVYPQPPFYIGDPPPTVDPFPIITWEDNGTGQYMWGNDNKITVSFTNGQAQA